MEMPIRIMMVLFVALVVSIAVIQFSRSSIIDSKTRLQKFGKDPDALEKQIIEIGCSASEIVYLAEDCLDAAGTLGPDESLCFVAKCSTTAPGAGAINAAWTTAGHDAGELSTAGMTGGQLTIYISYDPVGQVVLES